jgi:light-regulated signal transduction histidine kinase (bacteriophytochrome)
MTQLIEALWTMSRLTSGELAENVVDLSAVSHIIALELKKRQPERRVDFIIAEGLKVKGDTDMMRVVLENLLNNAWKFTGRHPSAKIELGVIERDGTRAYFVRDDGAGFDTAFVDRLFRPFHRLHTDSEFPGVGIGLAITATIIKRHGGRIWAEGQVEKGATFFFTL